ncbi:MAG: hypothetical protein AAGG11_10245 [Pseudomonadota bacterium]
MRRRWSPFAEGNARFQPRWSAGCAKRLQCRFDDRKSGQLRAATRGSALQSITMLPWYGADAAFPIVGQAPGPLTDYEQPMNTVIAKEKEQWFVH